MDEYTPEPDEPDHFDPDDGPDAGADDVAEPPHPVNWNLLSADDLEVEWLALNDWVAWLRRTGRFARLPCFSRTRRLSSRATWARFQSPSFARASRAACTWSRTGAG